MVKQIIEGGNMTPKEERVIQLLKKHLEQIDSLRSEVELFHSPAFMEWRNNLSTVIRRMFGEDSHEYVNFISIKFSSRVFKMMGGLEQHKSSYLYGLDKTAAQLRSIITIIETMGMED